MLFVYPAPVFLAAGADWANGTGVSEAGGADRVLWGLPQAGALAVQKWGSSVSGGG